MKIHVYGAGAIGGLVGGYMAKAGRDVVLVDKEKEHVDRMNVHGLRFIGSRGDETIPVKAALPEQISGPLELVFLAVKSQDTDAGLDGIVPHLGPQSTVVSLQNGLNPLRIAARVGAQRTVGAFVNLSADYHGPGLIMRGKEGQVYVGELDGRVTHRIHMIQEALSPACETIVTDNIYGYLWSKEAWGCQATIGALVDATKYEVLANEKYEDLLVEAVLECISVAVAEGVKLEAYDAFDPRPYLSDSPVNRENRYRMLRDSAAQDKGNIKSRTGIWRDLVVRKRKTEVPWLTGYVVERAKAHGIPAPVNEAVVKYIREIEDGIRPMSWENLDELNKLVKQKKP